MKKLLLIVLLALGAAAQASERYYLSPEEVCRRDYGRPHTHLLTGRVTCHF